MSLYYLIDDLTSSDCGLERACHLIEFAGVSISDNYTHPVYVTLVILVIYYR